MLLTANDIAPVSGTYRVLAPNGNQVATLSIEAGNHIPPSFSPSHIFESLG